MNNFILSERRILSEITKFLIHKVFHEVLIQTILGRLNSSIIICSMSISYAIRVVFLLNLNH